MKRFLFRLAVALLTFLVSLAFTSAVLFFTQIPDIEVNDDAVWINPDYVNGLEIEYKWTLKDVEGNSAFFVVTNRNGNPVYYDGYDKNSYVDAWILQDGDITKATFLTCRRGLKEQELKPNESAFFEISIPDSRKSFEIGFDFKFSDKKEKTTWIKVKKQFRYIVSNFKSKKDSE